MSFVVRFCLETDNVSPLLVGSLLLSTSPLCLEDVVKDVALPHVLGVSQVQTKSTET